MACTPGIYAAYAPLLVTSTTRPTGSDRQIGMFIEEGDTGRLLTWDGTGWIIIDEPIQTSTSASFSGITGGTPTYATRSRRRGGMCWFKTSVQFGGAPGSVTSLAVILPYTSQGVAGRQLNGRISDAAVKDYFLYVNLGTTACSLFVENAAGTYVDVTSISATVPFTIGAGDFVEVTGEFEMASRYS